MSIYDDAIAYLALSPRPSIELYARKRVIALGLSAPDAVSYHADLYREVSLLIATTCDPDPKRSQKNLAHAARKRRQTS